MSGFFWPEPSLDFISGINDPGTGSEKIYFVCHRGGILQLFDEEGDWRPAHEDELAQFKIDVSQYMGILGDKVCYTVEISEPGDFQYANLRANLGQIDRTQFNLAGRALQLCDWYKTHRYCGNCGAPTEIHDSDRAAVCPNCKLHFYPRLSPSIIVLVHREDEVLLGRNHRFPEGLYSTLAGFVEPGESIEETVRREVKEEVGVAVGRLSYRGSQPWPFPNSLMLGFHAEYDSGDIVLQEDEIADARWFRCDDLPSVPGKFAISRWLIDEYLSQRGFPI